MPLDSRYVIASDLQSLFRDKDTGLPLAAGVLTFYEDNSRTTLKNIYMITGTPPNYSYVALPNPLTLSGIGTVQDPNTGADIIVYYFPFDGNATTTTNTVDLYYVTCDSAGGVRQFTREGWPNTTTESDDTQIFVNYAPNGQFEIHTNISATDTTPAGQVPAGQGITYVAQGGWTFERPNTSTAQDVITFPAFNAYETNPTASPKFAIEISNQVPSAGDSFKDLRLKFTDVNKFASTTQQYTFSFTAQSNTGSALTVSLVLIKNFGTGGSTSTSTSIATLTIPVSYGIVQTSFVFGSNTGKTIGANGDDYLQLAIRFPVASVFDASLTNFILTPGPTTITSFPQTPDSQFSYQSLTASHPNYDGSSLYLPTKLTPQGLTFDNSEIGEVIAESNISNYVNSLHPTSNKLLADGTQYETITYSPLGIPFSRLQSFYWNSTLGQPIYGTGKNYFVGVLVATTNQLILNNNSPGIVTNTADGTAATGFTFSTAYKSINPTTGYFCTAAIVFTTNNLYIMNTEGGNVPAFSNGTAPVTLAIARDGGPQAHQYLQVNFSGIPTGGQYFSFNTSHSGAVPWYVWYQVDGVGVDPAPGGTGILVNIHSADTVAVVTQKTTMALNNQQASTILTTAGNTITAGSYFTANAITTGGSVIGYYVWYKVDNVGTDPKPPGLVGISVSVLSTDTNIQTAQKTQIAINQKFFAVPDYRGRFLRGWNNNSGNDPGVTGRYSFVYGLMGDAIGTLEFDEILEHDHTPTAGSTSFDVIANIGGTQAAAGGAAYEVQTLAPAGHVETCVVNFAINYTIRY